MSGSPDLTRRGALAAAAGLAACGRAPDPARAQGPEADALFPTAAGAAGPAGPAPPAPAAVRPPGPLARLKDLAPFPIGTEVLTEHLADPVTAALVADQFSQVTIGYEAQMEYVLRPDGSFRFDGGDRIADWTAAHGERLMGASLIWHMFAPEPFKRLEGDRAAFAAAYDRYIRTVAGHYRGRIRGWDVVNEPIDDDGNALRPCLWSRALGPQEYMVRAFHVAREADPDAVLFLNEGGQEIRPRKLDLLLRLVDRLLEAGAPVTGLGAQLHVGVDMAPGDVTRCLRAMAGFGLPIHVSEFDCSLQSERRLDLRTRADKRRRQQEIYVEAVEAFAALPARQRFAFTVFGVRDKDSWLRTPPNAGDGTDEPLLFDDAGAPKPVFDAVAAALRRAHAAPTPRP